MTGNGVFISTENRRFGIDIKISKQNLNCHSQNS
jgi:hypothetical protein